MSRSINGDEGGVDVRVPLTVFEQEEAKTYPFDGELVLANWTFDSKAAIVELEVNLLYKWVGCTRASRFLLGLGFVNFVYGVSDSVTHLQDGDTVGRKGLYYKATKGRDRQQRLHSNPALLVHQDDSQALVKLK